MLTYTSTKWVNGSGSPLNATNLNNIETGIDALVGAVNTHEGTLELHSVEISNLKTADVANAQVAETLNARISTAEQDIATLKNSTSGGGGDPSWEDLAGKPTSFNPTAHADGSASTYGAATVSLYGHVKISNKDLATTTHENGVAAGMDHSHSNYATKVELDDKADKEHTHSYASKAFQSVVVGDVTITADDHEDSLTLVAGNDVTISGDGTNDKITISATNTKVTAVENHYTPSAASDSELTVDASSTTSATWGSTALVTGVNIQRDSKGHVTGVTVDSKRLPGNVATSSTLGLVKSGGNITVSNSGVMSVVDDSHNHVISNIDGLQDLLDLLTWKSF